MAHYCIVGSSISYTLSPRLFQKLWYELGEEHTFTVVDTEDLKSFVRRLQEEPRIEGFTVTSPFKQEIIEYLDELTPIASRIGAVNTVRITSKGTLIGHNTDCYGFRSSLPRIGNGESRPIHALVCGTGGASKAVQEGLRLEGIPFEVVSRYEGDLKYGEIDTLAHYTHLINATPLGSVKILSKSPLLPYETSLPGTIFYDLNYDPTCTPFMKKGLETGGIAVNGLSMLWNLIRGAQWPFLSKGWIKE